jgi:hypothetical protein
MPGKVGESERGLMIQGAVAANNRRVWAGDQSPDRQLASTSRAGVLVPKYVYGYIGKYGCNLSVNNNF